MVKWILGVVALSACTGGGSLPTGPSPVAAEIEFLYTVGAAEGVTAPSCSGVARIFPSWWGFTHAAMTPTRDTEWTALFEDVPVGDQTIRIVPPSGCESGNVHANGLTMESSGDDLLFAFTVHPDGSVSH